MIRRRFLALAAACCAALGRNAGAQSEQPFVLRITGRDARVRLPDGSFVVIPVGSEIDGHPLYTPLALLVDFTPVDGAHRVFRGGFEL